jgi:hypothetical protein
MVLIKLGGGQGIPNMGVDGIGFGWSSARFCISFRHCLWHFDSVQDVKFTIKYAIEE